MILATDGDFNVGVASEGELVRLIEEKRKSGVFLTVLGFGMGNLQDAKLETARPPRERPLRLHRQPRRGPKVLVAEQGGTLVTVAKDVKLQVEFNPAKVERLPPDRVREPAAQDRGLQQRRQGRRRHGQRAHGHGPLRDGPRGRRGAGPGRRRPEVPGQAGGHGGGPDAANGSRFRMRYKDPETDVPTELAFPLGKDGLRKSGSTDFRFAAAVAAFGLLLRDSEYKGSATWADVRVQWAADAVGPDRKGYRRDFLELLAQAERLTKRAD